MRIVQTFILRLLVDTEHVDELRGALCAVAGGAEYPFVDEESLLAILRELVRAAPRPANGDRAHDKSAGLEAGERAEEEPNAG
jgi:hypothetical protein